WVGVVNNADTPAPFCLIAALNANVPGGAPSAIIPALLVGNDVTAYAVVPSGGHTNPAARCACTQVPLRVTLLIPSDSACSSPYHTMTAPPTVATVGSLPFSTELSANDVLVSGC